MKEKNKMESQAGIAVPDLSPEQLKNAAKSKSRGDKKPKKQ